MVSSSKMSQGKEFNIKDWILYFLLSVEKHSLGHHHCDDIWWHILGWSHSAVLNVKHNSQQNQIWNDIYLDDMEYLIRKARQSTSSNCLRKVFNSFTIDCLTWISLKRSIFIWNCLFEHYLTERTRATTGAREWRAQSSRWNIRVRAALSGRWEPWRG